MAEDDTDEGTLALLTRFLALRETEKSALRRCGKTVRILTDLPILVQSETMLTRKGRKSARKDRAIFVKKNSSRVIVA